MPRHEEHAAGIRAREIERHVSRSAKRQHDPEQPPVEIPRLQERPESEQPDARPLPGDNRRRVGIGHPARDPIGKPCQQREDKNGGGQGAASAVVGRLFDSGHFPPLLSTLSYPRRFKASFPSGKFDDGLKSVPLL
jgi:hypothetical protein